jgi:hypothetical protein
MAHYKWILHMKLDSTQNIQQLFEGPCMGRTISDVWFPVMSEIRFIVVSQVNWLPMAHRMIMEIIDPYE